MRQDFKRILFRLWPPYEARVAKQAIDAEKTLSAADSMEAIEAQYSASISGVERLSKHEQRSLESRAKMVSESENSRRETLETKALGFVSGFGIAISVISALPSLLRPELEFPPLLAVALAVPYFLGIAHLLTAVYWAVAARRVEGVALPSADGFVRSFEDGKWRPTDRIVELVSRAKFNEPILTKKANSLAVAESMFVRGLVLVALTSVVAGSFWLFGPDSTRTIPCKVPSVVGLDRSSAEWMLLELGLQPIRTSGYNSTTPDGVVMDQEPVGGTLVEPCDARVTIVVSLGPTPTPLPTLVPASDTDPTGNPSETLRQATP